MIGFIQLIVDSGMFEYEAVAWTSIQFMSCGMMVGADETESPYRRSRDVYRLRTNFERSQPHGTAWYRTAKATTL